VKPFVASEVAPHSDVGFIRAFCESQSMGAALRTATTLCDAVAPYATVTVCKVLPYWKFEGQYELALDLTNLRFVDLANALAGQWVMGGDEKEPFVIWNAGQDGPFAVPTMTWANLEVLPPPLPADERDGPDAA
jgi:hypothetical protein